MLSFKSRVVECVQETPRVKLLRLEKPASFVFEPGQFVILSIGGFCSSEGALIRRSYSVASAPFNDYIELCVAKSDAGVFSNKLHSLGKGDMVNVQGPFGVFTLKRPVVKGTCFVAGGSGIAPLMSMIRTLDSEKSPSLSLFYGFRTPYDFVYREELGRLVKKGFVSLVATIDKPFEGWAGNVGFVSEVIPKYRSSVESDAYVCGPLQMVNSTIAMLKSLGVDGSKIHFEKW